MLGIAVTVVMPRFAALIKVSNCRAFGATVILHGNDVNEARIHAEEIAARDGRVFLHPFDNANVIAGQGTMALEILEQTPDVDAIVVPVGGGGLIAGIGTATKALRADVRIVGVEATNAPCLLAALEHNAPVDVVLKPTLADGLAVRRVGALSFDALRRVVDEVVTVDEASIALAILRLIELEKSVVEGAGATPLAAFLAGKLDHLKGRCVVLVLCGGNIDLTMEPRGEAVLRDGWWQWAPKLTLPELRLTYSTFTSDYTLCAQDHCHPLRALLGDAPDEGSVVIVRPC